MTIDELHRKLSHFVGIHLWDNTHNIDKELAALGLYDRRYGNNLGMSVAYWLCDVEEQDKPVIVFTKRDDVPSQDAGREFSLTIFTNVIEGAEAVFNPEYLHDDIKKAVF